MSKIGCVNCTRFPNLVTYFVFVFTYLATLIIVLQLKTEFLGFIQQYEICQMIICTCLQW